MATILQAVDRLESELKRLGFKTVNIMKDTIKDESTVLLESSQFTVDRYTVRSELVTLNMTLIFRLVDQSKSGINLDKTVARVCDRLMGLTPGPDLLTLRVASGDNLDPDGRPYGRVTVQATFTR